MRLEVGHGRAEADLRRLSRQRARRSLARADRQAIPRSGAPGRRRHPGPAPGLLPGPRGSPAGAPEPGAGGRQEARGARRVLPGRHLQGCAPRRMGSCGAPQGHGHRRRRGGGHLHHARLPPVLAEGRRPAARVLSRLQRLAGGVLLVRADAAGRALPHLAPRHRGRGGRSAPLAKDRPQGRDDLGVAPGGPSVHRFPLRSLLGRGPGAWHAAQSPLHHRHGPGEPGHARDGPRDQARRSLCPVRDPRRRGQAIADGARLLRGAGAVSPAADRLGGERGELAALRHPAVGPGLRGFPAHVRDPAHAPPQRVLPPPDPRDVHR